MIAVKFAATVQEFEDLYRKTIGVQSSEAVQEFEQLRHNIKIVANTDILDSYRLSDQDFLIALLPVEHLNTLLRMSPDSPLFPRHIFDF